eukprot:gene17491-biopygen20381
MRNAAALTAEPAPTGRSGLAAERPRCALAPATAPQDTFRCGHCQSVLQRQNLSKHKPGTGARCIRQAQRVANRNSRAAEVSEAAAISGVEQGSFGAVVVPGPESSVLGHKRDSGAQPSPAAGAPVFPGMAEPVPAHPPVHMDSPWNPVAPAPPAFHTSLAPTPPAQFNSGPSVLVPAYLSGAAQDPPRASREEVSNAMAHASQAGLKYSGSFFTYAGSNRRWYITQNYGTVIDASVTPARQCSKCKTRHWVFDRCPAGAGRAPPPPARAAPAAPQATPAPVHAPRTASSAWATGDEASVRRAIAIFKQGHSTDSVHTWVLGALRPTTRRDYLSGLRSLLSYLIRHPPPPTLTLDDAISALLLERLPCPLGHRMLPRNLHTLDAVQCSMHILCASRTCPWIAIDTTRSPLSYTGIRQGHLPVQLYHIACT